MCRSCSINEIWTFNSYCRGIKVCVASALSDQHQPVFLTCESTSAKICVTGGDLICSYLTWADDDTGLGIIERGLEPMAAVFSSGGA